MNQPQLNLLTNDYDRALKLLKHLDSFFTPSLSTSVSLEKYTQKLLSFAEFFALSIGEKDLGILAIYTNDKLNKTAFISCIGLHPDFQGKGYGKLLMNQAITSTRNEGMEKIELEVNLKNTRAARFYYKYGFTKITEKLNNVRMRYVLSEGKNQNKLK